MNFTTFCINLLSVSPTDQYKISKAKKLYVTTHSECAICGNIKNLEVHHVIPVHINLELGCNQSNFITLCDSNNNSCHRWLGHFGDFKNKYNLKIRQYAIATRLFLEKMEPNRTFIISTNELIQQYSQDLKITSKKFLEEVSIFNK